MAILKLEDAPPSVQIFYDKGVAAMERNNLNYAMDMFAAVLEVEPRLLQVRRLLRAATIKHAQICPPKKLAVVKALTGFVRFPLVLKKDAFHALECTERWLRVDPLNRRFALAQCEAAKQAGLPEVAIQTLEIMKEHCPHIPSLLEPLAQLYADTEQAEKEYECRTVIARLSPNDPSAQKELKNAAARFTMGKAGWKKNPAEVSCDKK